MWWLIDQGREKWVCHLAFLGGQEKEPDAMVVPT